MLNKGCWNHYIYSKSSEELDGDAGYGVNIGLGDWSATKWVSAPYTGDTGEPWIGYDFGEHGTEQKPAGRRINSIMLAQAAGNAINRVSL